MKQVIIIRNDLDMSKGKSVAQGSHVSVLATQEASDDDVNRWIENGGKKIVLSAESKSELNNIIDSIIDLPTAKIHDLGYTELEEGTLTAGAVGPAPEDEIDKYTSNLALYK
jgi:PTH2 family peptidyl-tRNA hydrolase